MADSVHVAALNPTLAASRGNSDHWFYASYGLFLLATTLIGFVPDSFEKVAALHAGQRPPFPPILHVHAVVMASWVSLFTVQSLLPSMGRTATHRRLGVAAFVLMPIVVVVMALVSRSAWVGIASLPAGAMPAEVLAGTRSILSNILLEQIKAIILFPLLVGWALAVRRSDSETHKRFMIVALLLPLQAAIDRIAQHWLPTTFPARYEVEYGYLLLWFAPLLIFDLWRRGRIHRAYLIAIALNVPFFLANHFLWNSPRWFAVAPRLVGISNW